MTHDSENPQQMVPQESMEEKRTRVLLALKTGTTFGGAVWEKITALGVMREEDIEIDEGGWIGETRVGVDDALIRTIHLGIQDIPADLAERIIFENELFSDEQRLTYRLSHELCHVVGSTMERSQPDFARFFAAVEFMRKNGQALSALGNLAIYKNAGSVAEATEDVVELMNMYVTDPEYLGRYLAFLVDPNLQARRDVLGLHTIQNAKVAETIFAIIKRGVDGFLGTKKM